MLTVTNVSHGFGERQILDNASFRMKKGEHIGLIGANGEGKTSTAGFLSGLMGAVPPLNETLKMAGLKIPPILGSEIEQPAAEESAEQ
jgi:ATPase subunit of ABC transporter with duplicated ATPase domains